MQAETHKRTQTKTDPGGKTLLACAFIINLLAPKGRHPAITYTPKDDLASLMAYYATSYLPTGAPHGNSKRRPSRDPLEQDINELVETGRYQNRSEVIRAGLRLLLQQEAQNSAKLEALRNATSSGLMQLERGEYDEITSDDLAQYLDELGNQASH